MNYLPVTIIIPTYKDWERLRLCIDALEQQTYPAEFIQITIVNNAPNSFPPDNYYLPKNTTIINEFNQDLMLHVIQV